MSLPCRFAVVAALLLSLGLALRAAENAAHDLVLQLDPESHRLTVRDSITLPAQLMERGDGIELVLSSAIEITASDPQVVDLGEVVETSSLTINDVSLEWTPAAPARRYRVDALPEDGVLTLSYEGTFAFGLSDAKEEYTRGFRETAGIVSTDGVYLAGDSLWYPILDDGLVTFKMEVALPDGWHAISEGRGRSRGDDGKAHWESEGVVDEVHLVGGPFEVYRDTAGAADALVYLRAPDDALASKYLTATAQYIEMYRSLIGPYPYSKFALIENFWETGYGMPSFTLLGSQVIRFPFILTSSYPHEILHNWWGNSVFVDYASGNWCEGLTAYMADHLVQEQRARGEAYRRDTLQKYRSYVSEGGDFPLREFRSRHSAATEAVGYGKALMGFHMLRTQLGDDAFRRALSRFYRANRGKQASFHDLQAVFEDTADVELDLFFEQWLSRTGAPSLEVAVDDVSRDGDGFVVRGTIRQIQDDDPFAVRVAVVLDTVDDRVESSVLAEGRSTPFELRASHEPVVLRVDPRFDLFRLLDARETPPSIGQLFGAPRVLAILPSSDLEENEGYRELIDGWRSDSHSIDTVLDSEIDALPQDRSVWVLGHINRWAGEWFGSDSVEGLGIDHAGVELSGETWPVANHSFVAIRRHPDDVEKVVGWLAVDPVGAFEGMGRKLPHYGKYSYLAFEGEAPDNVAKGQWPTTDSPLVVDLRPQAQRREPLDIAQLEPRAALAELPAVFSQRTLAEHVRFLSSDELEGRGVGSEGLQRAAAYIAERFREAGLSPGGDGGGYDQKLTVEHGPDGDPVETANVIGYIPGARTEWEGQSVILSAHYDHLGCGWPDVYDGNEAEIHPGADDNASGVAVLLELARSFAKGDPPPRTLVFAAFTAEEAGRLGSRYFVEHTAIGGVRAVINLDTVGRLHDRPVSVLGTGTADEWPHVFRGVSYVTGVESRNVPASGEASDQMSFIERGIPAVQIFTEAHADYHRPTDTADKVDSAGLVKIATFIKEATAYLVEREEPLTVTIMGSEGTTAPQRASSGRKVMFGTVPEFGYTGPGVQIASLVPGSPAEKAGLQAGDVLIGIGGTEVADLRGFSELLKTLQPGQSVEVIVVREGEQQTATVTVEAR